MNADEAAHAQEEERLAAQLAAFDEALKAGTPCAPVPLPATDPTLPEGQLGRARACLRLLEKAWPRRGSQAPVPTTPADPLPPGTVVGPYRILERRGDGGMGVVYKAHHTQMDRPVALKFLKPERAADPEFVQRFQGEARTASALNHPHLCTIHAVGEHAGQPYLVMEWVDGGSLAQHLAGKPLPGMASAALLLPLAHAIAYAHSQGVVHRDLKPSNILLGSGFHTVGSTLMDLPEAGALPFDLKIVDFGLAKQLDVDQSQTQSGAVLGTPTYMAPEQAAGRTDNVGPLADVHALGAILYELLTGRPPFVGSTVLETLDLVRHHDPVPPRRLQPRVPRDLETICLKCLRKQPGDRYAGAAVLAEDLRRFQAGEPIAARPVGALERASKWVRRRPAIAGLLALVVLLAVSGAGLVTWQWRGAEAALHDSRQQRRERALAQVNALRDAVPGAVPGILADLREDDNRADVLPRLRELWSAGGDEAKRMRIGLALLPTEPATVRDELADWMLKADDPAEVLPIRDELLAHDTEAEHKAEFTERLWAKANDPGAVKGERLRALAALAAYDPHGERWAKAGGSATALLLTANPFYQGQWANALKPVRGAMLVALDEAFHDTRHGEQRQTAAIVLADYVADDPDHLADLLLDADARQYAVLLPVLAKYRTQTIARMRRELASTGVAWKDAPLAPTWTEPAAALVREIEQADGLFQERFALCQSLPLERLLPVVEGLRPSGYRPVRVRPWQRGAAVCVAVVWTRDGRDWRLDVDRTATQVKADEAAWGKKGFVPLDVAGYGDRYAALWIEASKGEQAESFVGQTAQQINDNTLFRQAGQYVCWAGNALLGPDGRLRYTCVWSKNLQACAVILDLNEPDFENALTNGRLLPADVQVHGAGPLLPLAELARLQLAKADKDLPSKPADIFTLWQRADALEKLGRDDEALAAFNQIAAQLTSGSPDPDPDRFRALKNAREGRAAAARANLAAYRKAAGQPNPHLEAVVGAWLGDEVAGLEQLEGAVRREPHNPELLAETAQTYGRCSTIVAQRNACLAAANVGLGPLAGLGAMAPLAELAERPARYKTRGLALLRQAVDNGWHNFHWMSVQTDLPPLRDLPEFAERFRRAHLDRHYSLVQRDLPGLEAAESHGLGLEGHLARCRELAAQGYRPVALSALADAGGVATASIWHRPKVPLPQSERLAQKRGRAAATLLHLDDEGPVWPLFRHNPQPETRSQLVWKAGLLGVDPLKLVRRLEEEADLSARRALIVALGDYGEEQLPAAVREPLTRKLLGWYRDDPDPGIHGAIDWLLRQSQEGPEARPLDWEQAKELARIDAGLTRRDPDGQRRWYVNGQGQTLVLFPGPVEFRMGSPADEPGRIDNERLHRCRIERSFAIESKPVTVEQYERFLKDRPEMPLVFPNGYPKDRDGPASTMSWYAAARYCNWLSAQEGIPRDQWCYPEHAQIVEGMKPYPDYLRRTGYRLATEAEWEYACRAGTEGSRYYGSSLELLPRYALLQANGQARTWPVGQKRPNDWGLFDLYGNLNTWVQNPLDSYSQRHPVKDVENIVPLNNSNIFVVRGGSFGNLPDSARSAARKYARPNDHSYFLGLRVARTCR